MAASKVIIRKDNSILFTKEPKENEWMPGRWGLPGGKYYLHESISEGTQRKIREEAGVACEIKGLFKIVQILMPEKTVYHFVFIADYVSGEIGKDQVFSSELKWLDKDEILAMAKDDLTEYYSDEILKEYFAHPERLIRLEVIKELYSFKDMKIQEWMQKGRKEN